MCRKESFLLSGFVRNIGSIRMGTYEITLRRLSTLISRYEDIHYEKCACSCEIMESRLIDALKLESLMNYIISSWSKLVRNGISQG